ncbi:cupin domain-containing protein [Cryptococcus gattii NT-10]|nr:cupin domain-containing protein [Cryptococcus gattii NT-10]
MSFLPNSRDSVRVVTHQIPAYRAFPNTSLQNYPFLIYYSAYPPTLTVDQIEDHLLSVGVVKPSWRSPMSPVHHYHSITQEAMVVTSGSARLCFGGPPEEGNIGRLEVEVKQGDVMIVPAGVSHGMLENRGGFEMLGGYPIGADDWDFCVGKEEEKGEAWERIKGLAWFEKDPVYGDKGPVLGVVKEVSISEIER